MQPSAPSHESRGCPAAYQAHAWHLCLQAMQGAFGPALGTLGSSSMQLVAAAPSQLGCSAYPQGTSFKGQAVLVQRGTCTFAVKVGACV